ncbi:MAG: hypothetical protein K0S53_3136 [Bacteroidetes bacterium]|jgi:hypothetical protein|nr:hypothetical protein [Bacteroidota bacterium]MDF2453686.1 hypothetical protein [Bacteroidota bacterium]
MKKIFQKKVILCFLLLAGFKTINAQALQDSVPVVISIINDKPAYLNNVKSAIKNLSHVNYVGFCNNHKIFLMYIDPVFHGSSTVFLSNLIKSTGLYELSLKEGTVKEILDFCDFKDPAEYDANKLNGNKN